MNNTTKNQFIGTPPKNNKSVQTQFNEQFGATKPVTSADEQAALSNSMKRLDVASLLTPTPLSYYESLVSQRAITAELAKKEQAAIIKAHDWGLAQLNDEEKELVERAISAITFAIRGENTNQQAG